MNRFLMFLQIFRHDFLVMLIALRNKHTPASVKGLLVVALL